MSQPVLIYVTVHTKENAEQIARELVEKKLASGVQISSTDSIYWWQNEIVTRGEFVLTIKTLDSKYTIIRDTIKAIHTYEVPPIEMIKIDKLEPDFLNWIQSNLA